MSSIQEMRPEGRGGFEIAILCALGSESDAVEATFDEFWEKFDEHHYGKAPGDANCYTFGRIFQHAVVLAYMPGMGKVASASVAANLRTSFPNIRLGLVVGICGGVPQPGSGRGEIFLGDIIISTGVVQFDFGRQSEHQVIRKDTLEDNLGRSNAEVRSFLHQIQGWKAGRNLRQSSATFITDICAKEEFSSWTRPPAEEDKLYHADYRHKHHDPAACITCAQCDKADAVCKDALTLSCEQLQCDEHQLLRRKQTRTVPEIHYGRIASSDVVMKSALHRDRIANQEEVLGFEMEGAGVWDSFPTIIVKGVCDYADSHKNKKWQKYASVAAAACVKSLLREWRGVDRTSISGKLNHSVDTRLPNREPKSNLDGGIIFNNNAKVANQAVNQTFHGFVAFN